MPLVFMFCHLYWFVIIINIDNFIHLITLVIFFVHRDCFIVVEEKNEVLRNIGSIICKTS